MKRVTCVGILLAFAGTAGVVPASADTPSTSAETVSVAGSARAAGVRVVTSVNVAEVTVGDGAVVRVKVPQARKASRVTLQEFGVNKYGTPAWVVVKTVKAKKVNTFGVTVKAINTAKYRALVAYKGVKKPVKSNVATVMVWRWVALGAFEAYADTGGTAFTNVDIAGQSYFPAWIGANGLGGGVWEEKFTLGRHCKAFKGVAGVSDDSDDGSSATVVITADDVPVYQSPVLTPGTAVPFEVPLAMPYRFAVKGTDTSAQYVDAFPAVGHPSLLCTGVDPTV